MCYHVSWNRKPPRDESAYNLRISTSAHYYVNYDVEWSLAAIDVSLHFFHHHSPYFVDYVIFIYLFFAIFFEAVFYLHKFVSLICLIYSHKHTHTPTPLWKRFSTSFYVNSCWSLIIVSDLIIGFVTATTTATRKISTEFVSTWFKCDLFVLLFRIFVCLLVNKPKNYLTFWI